MWKKLIPAAGAVTVVVAAIWLWQHDGEIVRSARANDAPAYADHVELVIEPASRVAYLEAAGVARPVMEATLGTRLMGSVTHVGAREGQAVRAGQVLVRIDARDLAAQSRRLQASAAEAQAMLAEAELQLQRMRALYAEDAAPRAQLDAAETGHARARASVAAASAAAAELDAVASYSELRAPFDGVVARRMVDPGTFVAPGTPLMLVQDTRRLRVSATAAAGAVADLRAGERIEAVIEGVRVPAVIEGIAPGAAGLFTVNAIVDNPDGALPATGAAELALPAGVRTTTVLPRAAIRTQGDLTGVLLRQGEAVVTRWVRLGAERGDSVEVLAGLRPGDRILVPSSEVR